MSQVESTSGIKESASGLVFQLHPLVLINISDHFVRIKANGLAQGHGRVFGILLGQQTGREVSISNSFELQIVDGMDGPAIDESYLTKKLEQYKQTFADLDVVGWYATGSSVEPSDMQLHRNVLNLNESPAFLLLNTNVKQRNKELPVSLFENEIHHVKGVPQVTFVQATYSIQTSEAERIAVKQVAKTLSSEDDSGVDQLSAHYSSLHAAVQMLTAQVAQLHKILSQMAAGVLPMDYELARQASSLLKRLPALDGPAFNTDYMKELNDALLTVLMASLTKGSNGVLEVVDKCNLAYNRS